MLQDIQTTTIDVNVWNALIFIVSSLIAILLGVIAWYAKGQFEKVSSMSIDIATMRENGKDMKEDVTHIKDDLDSIKEKISDHEKRIYRLGRFGNDDCKYIKQTINLANIIDSEEYCGNSKPYVIIGKKIKFPLGAHHDTESLIYASSGEDLDDSFEVDDAIGDRVGDYLFKRFSNKLPEDRTDNSNSNK